MKLLTIRIETILKQVIQQYTDTANTNLSQTIRNFIDLGIGYAQENPVTIQGPLGITRPLSKLAYGDTQTRLSVRVEEEQITQATRLFNENETTAIREAIRLGFIMHNADKVKFTDNKTSTTPLAPFKKTSFKNQKANLAQQQLTRKQ
ncbi:MAG: hypothetical protein NWE89_03535 [Candidatus Bathyarchaeota archaeon]|nr:hypothetical protein [Candidatus Bathyarchaeota archaeon]